MIPESQKYGSAYSANEPAQAQFFRIAKDHFQIDVKSDYDFLLSVKDGLRFYSLDIPSEIKEIFIPFSYGPIFWLYDSPLLLQIEEFMKFNFVRGKYVEIHKSIKENFGKWAVTKLRSEREYYADVTINLIERDVNKHNFFKMIIQAIIYTYQHSLYNPSKALELLGSAQDLVTSLRLADQTKEELKYILRLYRGFVYLKEREYENANYSFKEALEVKQLGMTAKLYSALCELNLGRNDIATYYIKEIFDYDLHRIEMALKLNSPGMFSYFLQNSFIYNIFQEKEFYLVSGFIEEMLGGFTLPRENSLNSIRKKISVLKEKKLEQYFTEETSRAMNFLDRIAEIFGNSYNTLVIASYDKFENQYSDLISKIIQKIRESFQKEVKDKLMSFEAMIKDSRETEKHLRLELENYKVKSKNQLDNSIHQISENYEYDVRIIEDRINNLAHIEKFDTKKTLSSNMTYNFIVAFIVFIIGGLANYSNTSVADASQFNSVLGFVLFNGAKWGVMSFLIGGVISLIIAGLVLLDKVEEKQRLLNRLNRLKIEKEKVIADLKISTQNKDKIMMDNLNSSISNHVQRAAELQAEMKATEEKQMKEAEEKVKAITDTFADVM